MMNSYKLYLGFTIIRSINPLVFGIVLTLNGTFLIRHAKIHKLKKEIVTVPIILGSILIGLSIIAIWDIFTLLNQGSFSFYYYSSISGLIPYIIIGII